MDRSQQEIAAVEKAAKDAEVFVRELDDLQLSLIGGGCGDPILA